MIATTALAQKCLVPFHSRVLPISNALKFDQFIQTWQCYQLSQDVPCASSIAQSDFTAVGKKLIADQT